MRYPEAIWYPDPTPNVYSGVNPAAGVICHSAEGYRNGLWIGIEQPSVSWHFSILYDGSVWQHHDLTSRVWHAGSAWGNQNLIGIEHEGLIGEPLTPAQVKASVTLTRWIARQGGWRMERGKTLFEHNEVSSTSCPNDRIPWEAYVEEDGVELRALTQSEAISKVLEAAQAVGPDEGQWFRITGGYRPKPGRTAYLVEVVE